MTGWCRIWDDMPSDPKWRTIARKSGQKIGDVMAVFLFLMVDARGNTVKRGETESFRCEDVATALDLETEDVEAIVAAMQGRVLDGNRLTGWEKRQPKREDDSSTDRVRAFRERKAAEKAQNQGESMTVKRGETQCNAPEAESEAEAEDISTFGACAFRERNDGDPGPDPDFFEGGDPPGQPGQPEPPPKPRPGPDAARLRPELRPEHFLESWNKLAVRIGKPRVRKLTPSRTAALKARIAGYSIDEFREVLGNIEASPFLRGEKNWCGATFDWVIKKTNFQKILEGNYAK